jgi:hypothetical protein
MQSFSPLLMVLLAEIAIVALGLADSWKIGLKKVFYNFFISAGESF